MTNEVCSVVFDLGGVLIDWNPRHLYRKIFVDEPGKMEWFLANVCTQEWNACQDAGRKWAVAVNELAAEHPEHEDLIRAYYERWEEMIAGPIEGTVEILRSVRDSPYHLYGLTNWSSETFPVARERFGFLDWFEAIVVSGEIGMIKPDAEIFHHLIELLDIEPSETVFIDDSLPNVETARRLGFRAIRFEDPEQLRGDLERKGVELEVSIQQDQSREE